MTFSQIEEVWGIENGFKEKAGDVNIQNYDNMPTYQETYDHMNFDLNFDQDDHLDLRRR